tara:strand:- start:569 stop:2092 length:1524 start_codon:yes stop_codon:yes gene_type:complete
MLSTDRETFLEAAENGANFIPLTHSWPADLETPLTTWLKVGHQTPPGVLLESVEGGESLGRWSVIASDPLWTTTVHGNELIRHWRNGNKDETKGNPFLELRKWLSPYQLTPLPNLPSLGQLYGMWGFEVINWIEPKVPIHSRSENELPDGIWMLMDSILIFDQVKRVITAVAYGDLTSGIKAELAFDDAKRRIKKLKNLMRSNLPNIEPLNWESLGQSKIKTKSNFTKADFEDAVEITKTHISNGDIFQLVLSQRLETEISQPPFDLYRSLRMVNPSPYMAFFDFGDWQLIGSSPEVMVKAEPSPSGNGILASLRPIAGTRPRGKTGKEDIALEKELLADPKEIAEHVMLVDLGRNDLGRVCQSGSVSVNELMVIEKYSHVMHIVSEIQGLLSPEKDVIDLLMASFPAGTVSGAPKIRAMELINQLESQPRGPYSGIYGSLDLNGALNTAITIRSMVVRPTENNLWKVQVQAGAGVVADSIPKAEYQETLNKAKGLLTAIACLGSKE